MTNPTHSILSCLFLRGIFFVQQINHANNDRTRIQTYTSKSNKNKRSKKKQEKIKQNKTSWNKKNRKTRPWFIDKLHAYVLLLTENHKLLLNGGRRKTKRTVTWNFCCHNHCCLIHTHVGINHIHCSFISRCNCTTGI